MILTVERRAFPRQPARPNRSILEWWDGEVTRSSPGRLLNISPAGALVRLEGPPTINQQVWIRMEQPARTPWIRGRVVHQGEDRVGLWFLEPCPSDFLEAALQGIAFGNVLGSLDGRAL
ncbi:PilZ domain-containing protein [Tautonia sociabilis]|uniref:PilZ domain-containing protein n=1 Tax=Tautonia sociabilis TaxID=2080755 RepID=UPI0013155098|nr:PilZ domain-containing protein [Tautonia sociabilis]